MIAAPAQAASHKCGKVSVTHTEPFYWEGSAHHIVAKGIDCRLARRLARNCLNGSRSGWLWGYERGPDSGPRMHWGSRFHLSKGTARATFYIAGSGGCPTSRPS